MIWPELTRKQMDSFSRVTVGKKHWSEKKQHCLNHFNQRLQSMGYPPLAEADLPEFFEYLNKQRARIVQEIMYEKRTDQANDPFPVIEDPQPGYKVHVSYLHRGAQFVIKELDGDYALLDNPKYSRLKQNKPLLRVHKDDLRGVRGKPYTLKSTWKK